MFKSFRQSFVGFFLGYNHPGDDPRNHPYAKACIPDQLIAAHIIEKMAKEFDKWRFTDASRYYKFYEKFDWQHIPDLTTKASLSCGDDLKIDAKFFRHSDGSGYSATYFYIAEEVLVNGVPLDIKEGQRIFSKYKQLKDAYDEAQRVAAEEKRRMEENEKKWNLAETLLGMKRTASGALISATKYECEACERAIPVADKAIHNEECICF